MKNKITEKQSELELNDFTLFFKNTLKISPKTIGGGCWIKTKKQQLKENRINKLRKIEGLKPNVILDNDEWEEGLISVKPLSTPISNLYYIDFKYNSDDNK